MFTMKKIFTGAVMATAYSVLIMGSVAAEDKKEDAQAFMDLKAQSQEIMPLKRAMKIVLNAQDGTITEAEIETEDAMTFYEIELAASDGNFYEYKIDPVSGSVLHVKEDFAEKVENLLTFTSTQREQKIDQKRFFEVINQIHGDILSLESEEEDGNTLYEVVSVSNGDMKQQLIDFKSGEIVFYRHHEDED